MFPLAKSVSKIGLAFSLAAFLAACSGGEEPQAKDLERAREHFDAGNMDKALAEVENVIQINANNADAHYLRALIAEQQQVWGSAFGELNLTLQLEPTHIDASVKLAQLSLALNDKENSRDRANKALELAPDNATALAVMAGVEFRDGNKEEARDYALKAIAVNPGEVTAVGVLAGIHAEDPERALQFVTEGLAADPDNVPLRLLRMRFLEVLGRTEEVIVDYQKLIEFEPESPVYIGKLAEYYVAKIRVDEAEELLRKSVKERPEQAELKVYLVRFLAANASVGEAIAELETLLEQEPESFQLRLMLAELRVRGGDLDEARKVLEETFNYDVSGANSQAARNALANLARGQKDFETAKKWIEEALEVEPENPDALVNRARIHLIEGNHREAIPDLRRVLRASPDSVSAALLLADAQQRERSPDLALDNYRSVLKLQPDNMIALYESAKIMAGQQNYDDAIANLEALLVKAPGNIQAINLLTGIYGQQGRWDDARTLLDKLPDNENTRGLADLLGAGLELRQGNHKKSIMLAERALEQNSGLLNAVPIIARAHASMGDIPAALDSVAPYIEKYPENATLYDVQAQLYIANKQPEKSVEVFRQSIAVAPERIATYIALARVLYGQGLVEEVEELYLQGIKSNPSNTVLRVALANRYQSRGEYQFARDQLEEAYKRDEGSMAVTNNLAALLIDYFPSEENLRRAQELTRDFEGTSNPAQLDTLGWLQYKLGNIQQAISLLEAAQAGGGQGLDYWYHLGMAYSKNGQSELAREQLSKVVESETADFHGRSEAEKVYKSL